jgi:hypothetical protein
MNKNLQNFLITIVVAVAAYFGYNVVINPPVNTLTPKVDTINMVQPVDTLVVDTLAVDTLK